MPAAQYRATGLAHSAAVAIVSISATKAERNSEALCSNCTSSSRMLAGAVPGEELYHSALSIQVLFDPALPKSYPI